MDKTNESKNEPNIFFRRKSNLIIVSILYIYNGHVSSTPHLSGIRIYKTSDVRTKYDVYAFFVFFFIYYVCSFIYIYIYIYRVRNNVLIDHYVSEILVRSGVNG